MINKKIISFLFPIALFGIHFLVNKYFLSDLLQFKELIKIHVFISLLSFVVLGTLSVIKAKFPDKVGFGYLAFVIVKMMISVVFLWPVIKAKQQNLKGFILSFFIIFFLHLFYEAYSIIQELKKSSLSNE